MDKLNKFVLISLIVGIISAILGHTIIFASLGLIGGIVAIVFNVLALKIGPHKLKVLNFVLGGIAIVSGIIGCFIFSSIQKTSKNQSIETTPTTTIIESIETTSETTIETTQDNKIILTSGELGEYGVDLILNEGEEFEEVTHAYFIPAGKYTITNIGNYASALWINKYEILIEYDNEDNPYQTWSEQTSPLENLSIFNVGDSVDIEIKTGYFIDLKDNSKFELVPIGNTTIQPIPSALPTNTPTPTPDPTPTPEPEETNAPEPTSRTVYVSNSNKYHYRSNCSGMKHYDTMTLDEAIEQGATPCSKCT